MKALALVVLGACSLHVDYTGTTYQCGANGECPADYACVGGYCLPDQAQGTTCSLDVASGATHTCAVRIDGTVWCWGANDNGQLGDNSTMERSEPVQVINVTGATAVVAGGAHSCALVAGGAVKCWGDNSGGQLGDGTEADSKTAVDVKNIAGATELAAGDAHTCALVGDVVECWGANGAGQIGD